MRAVLSVVLPLVLLVLVSATPTQHYALQGAKVVRVVPHTLGQLNHLHQLLMQGSYDFWKEPRALGSPVDIMVTLPAQEQLMASLESHSLKVQERLSDVGKVIAEQEAERGQRGAKAMDWADYHNYETITAWMASLAAQHPDLCSMEQVGTSYEGRPMYLLTISKGGTDKPGIFIDGDIHAREWISPAVVTYMVNQLLTGSHDDLLSSVVFYVMPVINPDGYSYTFTDDRLWRKTRSHTDSVFGCMGADPNRNWDFHWNEVGASSNPCSETYAGPHPFSEVEMQVVRDQITRLGNLKVYLTFHSFSQLWMYPWGFTTDLPSDWKDLDDLAQDAVKALTAIHGTHYEIGSSTNTIYAAAGGSDDWAKGVGGVKYAYTVELRDQGNYGFLLPRSQIIPTGEETFEALKVVGSFVKNTYGK
ncbi:Carboxypeptidase B [Chionoecetes opilio]|uniref:Carboxypeptidase B n=1 Tax=Chionoecetes opilio TaxID=41210 RepID=A0A8J8WF96_CHIOP|nr:Carboxypeptidase B [Chionoecetes opilio]